MQSSLLPLCVRALVAALACTSASALAQIDFPAASPRAELAQTVGITQVTVDYSRPSAKGREIFGGLVPYGEVWRTGANASTKLTFDQEVTLEGETVPAGTYALFTIPGEDEWTIILSTQLDTWGASGHDPEQEQLRVTVEPETREDFVESFTIGFDELQADGATLYLDWAETRVPVELGTTDKARILSAIEEKMPPLEDAGTGLLYNAASYYRQHGGDLAQAEAWIDRVASQNPDAYWVLIEQARIKEARGKTADALGAARQALQKARAAGADAGNLYAIEQFIEQHS